MSEERVVYTVHLLPMHARSRMPGDQIAVANGFLPITIEEFRALPEWDPAFWLRLCGRDPGGPVRHVPYDDVVQ